MTTANGQSKIKLSIVMPCLNEAETVVTCVKKARKWLGLHHVAGEVIIADNGSTDGSIQLAEKAGARVVRVSKRGYGSALSGGIKAAAGEFVVMGDADDSYNFSEITPFWQKLNQGYDLVMGNRFTGGIQPSAMPWLHRYIGNPILTAVGRLFFKSSCRDFHCGLRGFRRDSLLSLNLRTTGMEFASEMVVRATLAKQRICEVPVVLYPDGRSRPPHLRSWRDGWRHLRFLMMYSPYWLFLYPGLAMSIIGIALGAAIIPRPLVVGPINFDIHTLLFSSALIIVGFQVTIFAIFTKIFAVAEGLLPSGRLYRRFVNYYNLEAGLIGGIALFIIGLVICADAVWIWDRNSFGALDPNRTMRIFIPGITIVILGIQIFFSSFFVSILKLKEEVR